MQRILVPCDFSGPAVEGFHFAVELAAVTGGTIIVLSVISPQQGVEEPLVSGRFRENFKEATIGMVGSAQMTQEIRFGKLVPAIMEVISEKKIDLVVIGTRGSRGWEGVFMGSNVEKVVRTSPVPVYAVRGKTQLRRIKDIVFPCDLIHATHYGLTQLKKLQADLGARLHLVRIDTSGIKDQNLLMDKIRDYARFQGLSKYTINVVRATDEKDGILHFAKEIGADMIAMTTHGALDQNHLFMSSIAADVVNHAHLLTWTCIQQPVSQQI